MQKWITECEAGNEKKYPSVFMSHLFVLGGVTAESEREIGLGGARALPVSALPSSDYIALGHVHKKQKMGSGHCYYSGSPLQYSFDEANVEKVVKVFDLTKNGVENLRDIPLAAGRKLARLEATTPALGAELLKKYPEMLVELPLHLSEPLTATDKLMLYAHENLVELRVELSMETAVARESRKGLSDEQLFKEFYRSEFGEDASDELVQLFLTALAETTEGK